MTKVLVGVSLPQFTDDPDILRRGIDRAAAAGIDSVWLFDHLWPLNAKPRPFFEGWTSLAYAAAASAGIEIGTLVTRSSLRHPALLGKMAATVASIAPGRTIVAIGSGDRMSKPENDAFGIPYYAGERRVGQLESTVRAVKAYVSGEEVTQRDDFGAIERLPTSPRANPPPRIWVGGRGEELLRFTGEVADGWNGWGGTPETFARDAGAVAEAAGDRPIELSWGGQVIVGPTAAAAAEELGDRNPAAFLVGAPDEIARRLRAFIDAGARHLIVAFPRAADPEPYELLGREIRPALVKG